MTKMRELSGKVAAVTGGSGGIGRVIVRRLSEAGATVIILDRVAPEDDEEWVECDVRDDESVSAAIDEIDSRYGRLDALVYAAGINRDGVSWKIEPKDWDEVHAVNLRGAFLAVRNSVPLMRAGSGGSIVLIGSINGSRGKRGTAAYSASKAGLIGLMRSVARETGRFHIRVNVIEPGWVRTPMTEEVSEDVQNAAVHETLLGELVEPEDVAAMILFLCGAGGRRITGQIIRVDAGQYVGGS